MPGVPNKPAELRIGHRMLVNPQIPGPDLAQRTFLRIEVHAPHHERPARHQDHALDQRHDDHLASTNSRPIVPHPGAPTVTCLGQVAPPTGMPMRDIRMDDVAHRTAAPSMRQSPAPDGPLQNTRSGLYSCRNGRRSLARSTAAGPRAAGRGGHLVLRGVLTEGGRVRRRRGVGLGEGRPRAVRRNRAVRSGRSRPIRTRSGRHAPPVAQPGRAGASAAGGHRRASC